MSAFEPFRFEKEGTHASSKIKFKTVAEDFFYCDNNGNPEASLYSYSYIAKTQSDFRPVMFCYNGGPGASSSWVHMGLLGPKLVTFPDYPEWKDDAVYGDNENFLLDCADLVMINPPGTDYTFVREDAEEKYYNTGGDAVAVARFIEDWLKKYNRISSPVYLLGESYGTIRNLAVADVLSSEVKLEGIVSIGTSFNVGSPTTMLVEPNVRRLGANAACCHYHRHKNEMPLAEFVGDAMDFAYGEYAHALLMGSRLPSEELESTLDKLSYYTGLDKEPLREKGLRFDEITYLTRMIPGKIISTYDSRLTRTLENDLTEEEWNRTIASDPFISYADNQIANALSRYTEEELDAPKDRTQEKSMYQIAMRWNYKDFEKDTLTLPSELMEKNKRLRFFFVAGYYDLQSTFDFVTYYLGRYNLPEERVKFKVYESGHAAYVGGDSASRMSEDIRSFIKSDK